MLSLRGTGTSESDARNENACDRRSVQRFSGLKRCTSETSTYADLQNF
jgi:hypothetical protein